MSRKSGLPGPSEAVHLVKSRVFNRSVCGQSMSGEKELPAGTAITCPKCAGKR